MVDPKNLLKPRKLFSWGLSRLVTSLFTERLLSELSKSLGQLTLLGPRSRVLVVSGPNSLASVGGQEFITKLGNLCDVGTWVYSGSFVSDVKAANLVSAIADFKPQALIGLGGGVAMDYTKIGAAYAGKNGGCLESQETSQWSTPQYFQIPLILAPTLFGSGAESTTHAVIYRDGLKYSMSFGAPEKMMKVLIPELSESANPKARLYAALDAVSQGVETSWAKSATVASQTLALRGLRDVISGFDDYVEGRATANRELFVFGATIIGESMNTGKTTAPHAFSYFLAARFGLPHGYAVSILLRAFWTHMSSRGSLSLLPKNILLAMSRIRGAIGSDLSVWLTAKFAKYGLESDLGTLWVSHKLDESEFLRAVNKERLSNHPVHLTHHDLINILKLLA